MSRFNPKLLATVTTLTLLLLVVAAYRRSHLEDRQDIRLATMAQARENAARLRTLLEDRLQGLLVLAETWQKQEKTVSPPEALSALVPGFRRHFPAFQAVNWVDSEGVIRFVHPRIPNLSSLNTSLHEHPDIRVREVFRQAVQDQRMLSTPIIDLPPGGSGFALYIPLFREDSSNAGYLNGIFRLDKLMEKVVQPAGYTDFNLEMYEGSELAFLHQPDSTSLSRYRDLRAEMPVHFLNQAWYLRLTPSEEFAASLRSAAPQRISIFGGVMSFLAGLLIYLFGRRSQERHRLQQQLQLSEERYRTLVENAPVAIFTANGQGRFVSMNRPGTRLFGAESEADLKGLRLTDLAEQGEQELVTSAMGQALGGKTVAVEFSSSWGVRGRRRFRVSLLPTLDAEGTVSHIIGVADDITERSRAEEALRSLAEETGGEDVFQFLVERLARVLGTRWAQVGRLSTDGASVQVLGFWDTDHPGVLVSYDLQDTACESVLKGTESRHVFDRVTDVFPKDQRLSALAAKAYCGAPLHDHEGRAIGILTVFDDRPIQDQPMTRRIFEVFRRRAAAELERFIASEMLRANEEQMIQSRKMEAIGRLAGGIAHDFNNILTGITGYSNLIDMSLPADDPLRRDLREILKAADRAASLTRQLLAFSRRQVIEPRVLNLNEVLLEMHPLLSRLIGEDIELNTLCSADLWNVRADPGQFQQVVINLAVNARDAMPKGGKLTIETGNVTLGEEYIRSHVEVAPGEYVLLAVSDSGSGIPADIVSHIFEPFFTTKRRGHGTGLGLATVYGIVKQSGGHIWVYTEEGQGTTFKIYLPRVDEPVETPAEHRMTEIPTGSEQILLVEDDEAVREPVLQVLQRIGYQVLVAEEPVKAIELVVEEGKQIDLVVTDVVMPGMNGRELVERLRELHPDLKVIYISGYTDNVIVQHGVLEERAAFLQKPFHPGDLAKKIREVLEESF
jgi:PAS domain S-box-containing protein